jgi:hypothetical protein
MKTLKFSIILCMFLAFAFNNSNAQKPIVPNHDEWFWSISPSDGDLPCLTEPIGGNIVMDGFFTNSSREAGVYNYTYHEKGEGTLTGLTTGTGEYEVSWNFNDREQSFYDGFPKQVIGFGHTNITKDGKLFMTINYQYTYVWNEPWTNPIVWHNTFKPVCK